MNIPKHWQMVELGDISVSPQYGWTSKSSQNGKVKYLRTTDISSGNIDWKGVPFCQEVPNPIENFELKKGDLVISRSGSVGLSFLVENLPTQKVIFASYLIRIQPIIINPKFIFYFTKSKQFFDAILENSEGSAVQNVSAKRLVSIKIPIAPLKEQTEIVSILDEIFEKFETAKKQLAKIPRLLERYRQSVLERAVSGELTEDWREENNVEFEWEMKNISNISEKVKIGPFGSSLSQSDYVKNGVPIVNPIHIIDMKIIHDKEQTISNVKYEELKNYILDENDIIMARRGEMGRCAVITKNEKGWICGTGSLFIRPNKNFIIGKYLSISITSLPSKKYFEDNAIGTTMKNLNLQIVNNYAFLLPSLPEQTEIVNRVEKLLKKADEAEAKYKQAMKMIDKLQASVLAMAFRGELSEPQANDQPVSVLLEKIKAEKARLEQERKVFQKSQSQIKRTMGKIKKEKKSIVEVLKNSAVPELTVEECYRESGQPTPAAFFKDLRNNLASLEVLKTEIKPEGEVQIKLKVQ